jgi:hypothetical protein
MASKLIGFFASASKKILVFKKKTPSNLRADIEYLGILQNELKNQVARNFVFPFFFEPNVYKIFVMPFAVI